MSRRAVLSACAGACVGLTIARLPAASRDAQNEKDAPMRYTRKRGRRTPTPFTPPPPPPPPPDGDILSVTTSTVVATNQLAMGVHLVNEQFTMADKTNALIRLGASAAWACMHTQYFGSFGPIGNTGSVSGVWQDSAVPPDPTLPWGQMPWRHLDDWIGKCQSAGVNNIMLTFLAPEWMLTNGVDGSPGWQDVNRAFPASTHYADYAELMRRVVQRYGTMCVYSMSNEWKGLWGGNPALPSYNRWRYEDFTTMWNLGWDAMKAQNPNIKFGGPYLGFPQDSGNNVGSLAKNNQLFFDDPPVGQGGHVDSRRLDAINYWLAHTHGYDFYALDQGYKGSREIITWLRGRGMTKPVRWIEFYSGVNTTLANETAQLAENYRQVALAGGDVVFLWGPEQGSVGASNAPANAVWAATNAATEQPNGTYMRYMKTYFPPGTPLVLVTTNNPLVTGLASASNIMIINRQSVSSNVNVIVNNGTPSVTTVGANLAVVRALV